MLVCIDGSDASYEGLRFAGKLADNEDCDIILLFVRPIDQGLRSGGLQVRVARENMLDWGLELPGITHLKRGLDMLVSVEDMAAHWSAVVTHTDTWGDPLGDNKVEYRHSSGKSIVLKLKTAPDPASGILDQYELGPYNLMIMGAPTNWRGEIRSFFDASVTQRVAMMAPCSVMVARGNGSANGKGHMICTDGTRSSLDAMRRDAVLAQFSGDPITLFAVAQDNEEIPVAERVLEKATEMLMKIDIPVADAQVGIGNPVEQIIKAGNDYSVIAVADSGKPLLRRFVVKNTSFSIMGGAKTSVLKVR
jgi:nucleotide-binding universal stress UspA family protein